MEAQSPNFELGRNSWFKISKLRGTFKPPSLSLPSPHLLSQQSSIIKVFRTCSKVKLEGGTYIGTWVQSDKHWGKVSLWYSCRVVEKSRKSAITQTLHLLLVLLCFLHSYLIILTAWIHACLDRLECMQIRTLIFAKFLQHFVTHTFTSKTAIWTASTMQQLSYCSFSCSKKYNLIFFFVHHFWEFWLTETIWHFPSPYDWRVQILDHDNESVSPVQRSPSERFGTQISKKN